MHTLSHQRRPFLAITIIALLVGLVIGGGMWWAFHRSTARNVSDNPKPFYKAYTSSCDNSDYKHKILTDEGDPIFYRATLSKTDKGCAVTVAYDTTQDKFGVQQKITYTCQKLELASNYGNNFIASECTGDDGGTDEKIAF